MVCCMPLPLICNHNIYSVIIARKIGSQCRTWSTERKVKFPTYVTCCGIGHVSWPVLYLDRVKCPVCMYIQDIFSPIHYWIGTGHVIKRATAGHIGNFTFRPVWIKPLTEWCTLYTTLSRGKAWGMFKSYQPTVPVYMHRYPVLNTQNVGSCLIRSLHLPHKCFTFSWYMWNDNTWCTDGKCGDDCECRVRCGG